LPRRFETTGRKRALKGRSVADKRGLKPERADKAQSGPVLTCAGRRLQRAAALAALVETF
jgi:hypothetical protein